MPLDRAEYLDQIPQIQKLFSTVFKRSLSSEYIRWRYAENPLQLVTSLTERTNKIVTAHYASTPNEFQFKNQSLKGSMVAAVMTHPDLQGKGYFQTLGYRHETLMKEMNFDFLYAFPNKNSDPIFIHKLGWKSVYEIPFLSLDLKDRTINTTNQIEEDNDFSKFDYDKLSNRNNLLCVNRSTKYLKWRYFQNPLNKYNNLVVSNDSELSAYAIVKKAEIDGYKMLDVLDFYIFDSAAKELLLENLVSFAFKNFCTTINLWCPRHFYFHQYLTQHGFQHRLPVTYLTYKSLTSSTNEFDKFSKWWITMGDSDVF